MTDAEKESEARCKAMLHKLISMVKEQTMEMEALAVRLKATAQLLGPPVHALPLPVPAPMATLVTAVDHAVAAAAPRAEAVLAPESPTKCSTSGPDTNAGDLQVVVESDPETGVPTVAEHSSAPSPKLFSTTKQDTVTPTRCSTACRSCNTDVPSACWVQMQPWPPPVLKPQRSTISEDATDIEHSKIAIDHTEEIVEEDIRCAAMENTILSARALTSSGSPNTFLKFKEENLKQFRMEMCASSSDNGTGETAEDASNDEGTFDNRSKNVPEGPSTKENISESAFVKQREAARLNMEPEVGMVFHSEDQAYLFYNYYAQRKGFSVRKGHLGRRKDGSVRNRVFLCSKEGVRQIHRTHVTKGKRETARTNCMARIEFKVGRDGVWLVSKVIYEHNHLLVRPHKLTRWLLPPSAPLLSGRRRPPPARAQIPPPPPWQPHRLHGHFLRPAPLQPFRPPARTPPAAVPPGASAAGGGEVQAVAAEFVTSERVKVVAMLGLALALCNADRVVMSVAIVPLSQAYGWTPSFAGVVQSSFLWGYLISPIIGGALVDYYGGKRVMAYGVALWSLATFLSPWAAARSLWLFLSTRVLLGIAEGVALPSMNNMVLRWFPRTERSSAVGIAMAGFQLGNTIGLLLSPIIMSRAGIFGPFVIFGLFGFLWVLVWISAISGTPGEHAQISAYELEYITKGQKLVKPQIGGEKLRKVPPFSKLLSKWPTWALISANAMHSWGYFVILSWMPVYFKTIYHVNLREAAWFSALPWVMMAVLGYVAGLVSDMLIRNGTSITLTRKIMQTIGFVGPGIALLGLNAAKNPITASAWLTIAVGLKSFGHSGFLVNLQEIAPQYAGVLHGMSNTAGTFAAILGTVGAGFFVDRMGSFRGFLILTSLLYFSSTLFWDIFATGERVDFDGTG